MYKLSFRLLTSLAMLATSISMQAMAADGDRRDSRDERRAERRAERSQQQTFNRSHENAQRDLREAQRDLRDSRRNTQFDNRAARQDVRQDNKFDRRLDNLNDRIKTTNTVNNWNNNQNRWQNNWRDSNNWDRKRFQASNNFRNWDDQRRYVRQNLRRINEIGRLNALQQQQLDAQMRAAYLAYHNNNYNGAYNWDTYSQPQFLDYLQSYQPSLLDRILGYLGIGGGFGGGFGGSNYLYSQDWNTERDQLSQNLFRIHQLRLSGQISASQEAQLMAQMRAEFQSYHNNSWNGGYGLTQYSDPGFIDYLNTNRPSVLTTIRSYLGM